MKAVLISIQPQWCEKIFNGEKTIEVRKSRPKIDTPFKVYVYMTKRKWIFKLLPFLKNRFAKVIGEFVCDRIEKFSVGSLHCDDIEKESCLSYSEMINYFYKPEELDGKTVKWGFGWHISDLKIYDKPKELGEFGNYKTEWVQWYHSDDKVFYPLKRMSGSWCYIEEE